MIQEELRPDVLKLNGWIGGSRFEKFLIPQVPQNLGGGFKYFLFSPLFGEDFQFD